MIRKLDSEKMRYETIRIWVNEKTKTEENELTKNNKTRKVKEREWNKVKGNLKIGY